MITKIISCESLLITPFDISHITILYSRKQLSSAINMTCSNQMQLEQLECLRSDDTPPPPPPPPHTHTHLMITHTIESYWIPSQKKTKSKLQI